MEFLHSAIHTKRDSVLLDTDLLFFIGVKLHLFGGGRKSVRRRVGYDRWKRGLARPAAGLPGGRPYDQDGGMEGIGRCPIYRVHLRSKLIVYGDMHFCNGRNI